MRPSAAALFLSILLFAVPTASAGFIWDSAGEIWSEHGRGRAGLVTMADGSIVVQGFEQLYLFAPDHPIPIRAVDFDMGQNSSTQWPVVSGDGLRVAAWGAAGIKVFDSKLGELGQIDPESDSVREFVLDSGGERLVVGTESGFTAYAVEDASVLWHYPCEGGAFELIYLADAKQVLGTCRMFTVNRDAVLRFDVATGALDWSILTDMGAFLSANPDGEWVLIGGRGFYLYQPPSVVPTGSFADVTFLYYDPPGVVQRVGAGSLRFYSPPSEAVRGAPSATVEFHNVSHVESWPQRPVVMVFEENASGNYTITAVSTSGEILESTPVDRRYGTPYPKRISFAENVARMVVDRLSFGVYELGRTNEPPEHGTPRCVWEFAGEDMFVTYMGTDPEGEELLVEWNLSRWRAHPEPVRPPMTSMNFADAVGTTMKVPSELNGPYAYWQMVAFRAIDPEGGWNHGYCGRPEPESASEETPDVSVSLLLAVSIIGVAYVIRRAGEDL